MSSGNQGKQLTSVDVAWAKVASAAVRSALDRRGVSYAQLADYLGECGGGETVRAIEGKIRRGTFRFTFLLQVTAAIQCECPSNWAKSFSIPDTWESRASAVIRADIAEQPWITEAELGRRLQTIGIYMPPGALRSSLALGTFTAAFYFQCATVCRFGGMALLVDGVSVREAAEVGLPGLSGSSR